MGCAVRTPWGLEWLEELNILQALPDILDMLRAKNWWGRKWPLPSFSSTINLGHTYLYIKSIYRHHQTSAVLQCVVKILCLLSGKESNLELEKFCSLSGYCRSLSICGHKHLCKYVHAVCAQIHECVHMFPGKSFGTAIRNPEASARSLCSSDYFGSEVIWVKRF